MEARKKKNIEERLWPINHEDMAHDDDEERGKRGRGSGGRSCCKVTKNSRETGIKRDRNFEQQLSVCVKTSFKLP